MFYRKTLEDNLIHTDTIEDFVSAFEIMCRERTGLFDDMLLFESGNFSDAGKKEFYFTLARQYNDSAFSDATTLLRLDIIYPEQPISFKTRRILKNKFSSDQCRGSFSRFFEKVLDSSLITYIHENNLQYLRYEIHEEEID